jgi:hypothetical protein
MRVQSRSMMSNLTSGKAVLVMADSGTQQRGRSTCWFAVVAGNSLSAGCCFLLFPTDNQECLEAACSNSSS